MRELAALRRSPDTKQITVAIAAATTAFLAYSCVYAYRKPFTVADFQSVQFAGVSYQTLLIISQVIGYMLSKFAGIRFISELKNTWRFASAILLVGAAWLCLLGLAVVPAPYGALFLFFNGFFLGFLWGIIFSYLEGRKSTDFIGAVMAVSFIFAGGFTRSIGKWLLVEWDVSDKWMPFITGLFFAAPLVLLLRVLEKIPSPTIEDVRERELRRPMSGPERLGFLRRFAPGISVITITYVLLTVMRDLRDNYMSNIWSDLGYGSDYSIFTTTETFTSLIVLAIMCLLVLIRNSMKALSVAHLTILCGILLAGISSLLFMVHILNGALWMQLVSIGLYLGYIPFNCIVFERMIAAFRIAGNIGFLMYFADAFGYLGSVSVMLIKEFSQPEVNWTEYFSKGVIAFSIIGLAGTAYSYFYFLKKYRVAI